ncbi:MAG: low temperature requirement protein A [Acidimicrobiia bacterium]
MTNPDAAHSVPLVGARKVGWLELFYDLVFVAAIIAFSDAVSEHPDGDVIATVVGTFAAVWWIWLTTTLVANRFRDDDPWHRALILVQMVLLTMISLVVGDGVGRHEGAVAVLYALLCLNVSVMHAREVGRPGALGALARARRNEYAAAAIPLLATAFIGGPARYVLWGIGLATIVLPAIAYRFGRERGEAPLHEEHLVERMGLLTIIVCGESFVKVSLLASAGALEDLDVIVLGALFLLVFSMWWSYFDDIPESGLPNSNNRLTGWFLGHFFLQICLVGIAIGYSKLLKYELDDNVDFDKMLLAVGPIIGVYLSLALIGACTRRRPAGPLLALRLGSALALVPVGVLIWRADWVRVDATAIFLSVFALAHGALAMVVRRRTRIVSREADAAGVVLW